MSSADQIVDIPVTPRQAAILDRLCDRAERGQLELTPREFEGLQQLVMLCEQYPKRALGEQPVSRADYDAMIAARDHCKQQATDAGERLAEANAKLRARLTDAGSRS